MRIITLFTTGKNIGLFYRLRLGVARLIPHIILAGYSVLAVFPVIMILMNSFKMRKAIFGAPFAFPNTDTFSLIGYETVLRAYPNNPAARRAMRAQAKCRKAM